MQTSENGRVTAYVFRQDGAFSYLPPVLIKKFPGHPNPKAPSQYIHPKLNYEEQTTLCEAWPGFNQWCRSFHYNMFRTATSQYIYKFDEQGNALWKQKLYIEEKRAFAFFSKNFYFQAYQTQAEGEYTYQGPVEIDNFPPRATF